MAAWGLEEEQPESKPTKRMSKPLAIGLLLQAVHCLLHLAFKAGEFGRVLPVNQEATKETTDMTQSECDEVGHKFKSLLCDQSAWHCVKLIRTKLKDDFTAVNARIKIALGVIVRLDLDATQLTSSLKLNTRQANLDACCAA